MRHLFIALSALAFSWHPGAHPLPHPVMPHQPGPAALHLAHHGAPHAHRPGPAFGHGAIPGPVTR